MERLEKDDFLQISKAIEIFNTSYSSIQRLCRKEKMSKRVKKKSNKYVIQYSLLIEHFDLKASEKEPTTPRPKIDEPKQTAGAGSDDKLVDTLNSQIDFLTSQINSKDSQIDKLLQRQFEQNTIIQTLQTSLSNKIDSSVPLLIDSIKEVRTPAPATPPAPAENDNGFTIASAVLILLTVLLLILFVSK